MHPGFHFVELDFNSGSAVDAWWTLHCIAYAWAHLGFAAGAHSSISARPVSASRSSSINPLISESIL